jgi:hypothetical protein
MHTEICTLQQLIRNVAVTFPGEKKLSSKQVKQALVVLWKHNCLTVECAHDVDLSEITMDANGLETKLKMTGLLYRYNINRENSVVGLQKKLFSMDDYDMDQSVMKF